LIFRDWKQAEKRWFWAANVRHFGAFDTKVAAFTGVAAGRPAGMAEFDHFAGECSCAPETGPAPGGWEVELSGISWKLVELSGIECK
jgi:hypothetical protein